MFGVSERRRKNTFFFVTCIVLENFFLFLPSIILKMFADHIYYPLVKALRHRPDEIAVSVGEKTCDNRHFAMLIAPIMNELDTFSEDTVALLLEDEPLTLAAMVACLLCGKTIVPVQADWSDAQRSQVMRASGATRLLSKESMYYYYWVSYEDAICRIDSGYLPERDIPRAARVFDFGMDGQLSERIFSADDLFLYFCAPYFKNIVKNR